ncbi:MAG: neutral zinc metallopeptidase [Sphingomonadaceae bacterium]|nr:neutral zinc metallopeptidase [Sphingomonadaceae bacterium]
MRLDDIDPSGNINDQGAGGGGFGGGGGGGMLGLLFGLLPMLLGRKMGCGTLLIIAVVGYFVMSSGMLNLGGSGVAPGPSTQQGTGSAQACDTESELYACRVFTSAEQTWTQIFREAGSQYQPARLEFYQGGGQSGCGAAQSAMGPFYCPSDRGIYLDTSFFGQMEQQMGAGGDFAYAYVVAHEMGHHIQNITGVADNVRRLQSRASQAEGNQLQVRMELQADCYAGVWAARNRERIEPGDIEEGMRAANAIGDDTLMRQAGRTPVESMFTHGTSEQRMAALQRGLQAGTPQRCNFFEGIL